MPLPTSLTGVCQMGRCSDAAVKMGVVFRGPVRMWKYQNSRDMHPYIIRSIIRVIHILYLIRDSDPLVTELTAYNLASPFTNKSRIAFSFMGWFIEIVGIHSTRMWCNYTTVCWMKAYGNGREEATVPLYRQSGSARKPRIPPGCFLSHRCRKA